MKVVGRINHGRLVLLIHFEDLIGSVDPGQPDSIKMRFEFLPVVTAICRFLVLQAIGVAKEDDRNVRISG